MKIIGLAAEYNPFHRGHAHQIAQIRRIFGPDCCIVAALSGCFVQRGEPAMFDKHARAAAALDCGADLVLELPVPWAIASAEGFGWGAVSLLDSLGNVDCLVFGSETGELAPLQAAAALLADPALDPLIRAALATGVGYARARQQAAEALSGGPLPQLASRNDILALEYLKALGRLGSPMAPCPLRRDERYPAASLLRGRADYLDYLPEAAAAVFRREAALGRGPVPPEGLAQATLARLRTLPPEGYAALPDAAEGLEARLRKAARQAVTLEDLVRRVTTKRYPAARVRRMALAALLGVEAGMAKARPPYLRPLALNSRGAAALAAASPKVPVITKPAQGKSDPVFRLEARACGLYALAYPDPLQRDGEQDWRRSPYVLK